MILDVDTVSPTPVYEQLRSQFEEMILAGQLPVGHRLPTIRQLAEDLGIAPGTVGRVYQELESAGLVTSRVRHGTVVAAPPSPSPQVAEERADEAARAFARSARRLGLDLDDALTAVRNGWAATAG